LLLFTLNRDTVEHEPETNEVRNYDNYEGQIIVPEQLSFDSSP